MGKDTQLTNMAINEIYNGNMAYTKTLLIDYQFVYFIYNLFFNGEIKNANLRAGGIFESSHQKYR